ncbi:MAG: hypothetical protein AAGA61_02600 [Pseudomonadota bacterium]
MRRFEACELPEEEWTHDAHVRVAWVAQLSASADVAEARLRDGILRFNTRVLGRRQQYHETVTMAFARIIRARARIGESWPAFLARSNDILSREDPVLLRYYSNDRLFSDKARAQFVEPDLQPLPDGFPGDSS